MAIERRTQKRDAQGKYDFSKAASESSLASSGLEAAEYGVDDEYQDRLPPMMRSTEHPIVAHRRKDMAIRDYEERLQDLREKHLSGTVTDRDLEHVLPEDVDSVFDSSLQTASTPAQHAARLAEWDIQNGVEPQKSVQDNQILAEVDADIPATIAAIDKQEAAADQKLASQYFERSRPQPKNGAPSQGWGVSPGAARMMKAEDESDARNEEAQRNRLASQAASEAARAGANRNRQILTPGKQGFRSAGARPAPVFAAARPAPLFGAPK